MCEPIECTTGDMYPVPVERSEDYAKRSKTKDRQFTAENDLDLI